MAPERTCSICRKKAGKGELVRFVLSAPSPSSPDAKQDCRAERLVIDPLGLKPGRGVYSHIVPGCLFAKGVENKLFGALQRGSRPKQGKKETKPNLAERSPDESGPFGEQLTAKGKAVESRPSVSLTMADLIREFLAESREGRYAKAGSRQRKNWCHRLETLVQALAEVPKGIAKGRGSGGGSRSRIRL